MPFIQGRYHINPTAGRALETARDAEAAALALEQAARQEGRDDSEDSGDESAAPETSQGPVHRIEIEASELVPGHSGRAQRGFVARIHRQSVVVPNVDDEFNDDATGSRASETSPPPETHVFSDHHDLVDFLRDQLANDCNK